jgi:23S rRNA pseudouridine1911/1915/1917 synthase
MAVVKYPAKVKESHRFDATTAWVPIETGQDTSLIDVTIHTGVTHQIRCHLAAAGHPIVGDTLYGSPSFPSTTNHPLSTNPRHWLHAARILLTHPTTGTPLDLTCPLPPDWPVTH